MSNEEKLFAAVTAAALTLYVCCHSRRVA